MLTNVKISLGVRILGCVMRLDLHVTFFHYDISNFLTIINEVSLTKKRKVLEKIWDCVSQGYVLEHFDMRTKSPYKEAQLF